MNIKKTLLAVSFLPSSSLVFPYVSYAKQDLPGGLQVDSLGNAKCSIFESGNAKYDEFVMDLCCKTFIPTSPTYWGNSETLEVMYAFNETGTSP